MVTKARAQTQAAGAIKQVKSVCTHCSVGCTVIAEVENGVWIGQEPGFDSPFNLGAPLRQGRLGARAWSWRAAAQIPDEAGRRQVPADPLGPGDQRDRRQAARDPRGQRPRCRLLHRRLQAQQRGRLSVSQVRRLLGHEQLRQPGPDLPFDHGRRCRQHLGLWRDDQLLQRHPQVARDAVHRLQCRRGAPRGDAPHPACQGAEQRAAHRLRPALHPHRGARRRVRALPLGHRRGARLGHPLAHLRERLGGQGVHPPAGLGHGPDPRRGRAGGRPRRSSG